MKKIVAILLALILSLPLFISCGNKDSDTSSGGNSNQTNEEQKSEFSFDELVDQVNAIAKENGYGNCYDFEEKEIDLGKRYTFEAFDDQASFVVDEENGEIATIAILGSFTSKSTPEKVLDLVLSSSALCTPDLSKEDLLSFHKEQRRSRIIEGTSYYDYRKDNWFFMNAVNVMGLTLCIVKDTAPEEKQLNDHVLTVCTMSQPKNSAFSSEIFVENASGGKFDKAVYDRNEKIKKTYGCTVREVSLSSPDLKNKLLAGEYVGDLLYGRSFTLIGLADQLQDMSDCNLGIGKSRWNYAETQFFNLGGKTLFASTSGFLSDSLEGNVILFNKDLLDTLVPGTDLYSAVEQGTWTVDTMYQVMANANIGGKAYVSSSDATTSHFLASNQRISNSKTDLSITIPSTPSAEIMETLQNLRPILGTSYRSISKTPAKDFSAGGALFCSTDINSALNQTYHFKVGVLPFPKLNDSQTFYCNPIQMSRNVFSVPKTVENGTDWQKNGFKSGTEQSVYLLNVLAYETQNFLGEKMQDELFSGVFTEKKDRDMLRSIMEYPAFDPVFLYNVGSLSQLFSGLVVAGPEGQADDSNYDNFLNLYDSLYTMANKKAEEICSYFAE